MADARMRAHLIGAPVATLKSWLRKTFAYRWLRSWRAKRQLAQWTSHDQEMLEFYRGFVSAGDVVFDVGANIGNRVKILLRLGARVVAVEPQRECAKVLRAVFGRDPQFVLVEKALGAAEGQAEIMISDANTISSLSREWMDAVVDSGRFGDQRWDRTQPVALTTLDRLIEQYGDPAFVKIDVEGFEYEVVKGLSRPVAALSLEFTPEVSDSTFRCLEHLERLGEIRSNYSVGESMRLALEQWVPRSELVGILSTLKEDHQMFGDVYVRSHTA
jgi:FkbM family methyltransferase